MTTSAIRDSATRRALVALVAMVVFVSTLALLPVQTPPAGAQGAPQWQEVWGIGGGHPALSNPKVWEFAQSDPDNNVSGGANRDLGSATVADPNYKNTIAYDAGDWSTRTLHWREYPGPDVANHFRKEFDLADIGITNLAAQVERIRVTTRYDDSIVLYLNGTEVYRSIRGNLDPDYSSYPLGTNIPYDAYISWGGFENFYVHIPNWLNSNDCEFSGNDCDDSPYENNPPGNLGTDPPEIPVSLLVDGTNVWSATTWNQSGGGSGDSQFNHTFQVEVAEIPPPKVLINEVVAVNDGSYTVDFGLGPKTPDWFELHNISTETVNLLNYSISDLTASWTFPSYNMAPGEYLIIAANDGNDGTTTPMQTNFKLSSLGDTLKLIDSNGFVSDDYGSIPQQFSDSSYGRVLDGAQIAYLVSNSPGGTNSGAGTAYVPILRLFPDRLYNVGEPVAHQVNAFDPDGDSLQYALLPDPSYPPGISIDTFTGAITGTATTPGEYITKIRVVDGDNDIAEQQVTWTIFDAPISSPSIVLNEYNAVDPDLEFLSGSPIGNGGDWFEFVVVEDNLDLRGWIFDFYDLKGADDQLRMQSSTRFRVDRAELAAVPAGTIIVLSQNDPDDLSFDGLLDWTITLQMDNTANGAFFDPAAPGELFNSTRHGQTVIIRDENGAITAPLSGETEAWDDANGGVSGGEVMSLCVNPAAGSPIDPLTDYKDNGFASTQGLPNICRFPDPLNPPTLITFTQNLAALRLGATLGAGSGDVNCSGSVNVADALDVLQFSVGLLFDTGPCFMDLGGPGADLSVTAGNVDGNLSTNVNDAVMILQCSVGQTNVFCP